MINKNSFYTYLISFIVILIPTTGRFVYGLTIMTEMFLLLISGTLMISLINKLNLNEIKSVLILITLFSVTILYRQLIVITYAEIALTLGFIFYLPTLSVFLINNITQNNDKNLKERLKINLKKGGIAYFMGLIFFLIRDLAGYGTFTFFGQKHHIYEKVILKSDQLGVFSFIATIPGALILGGLLLIIHIKIDEKMKIIQNVERQK